MPVGKKEKRKPGKKLGTPIQDKKEQVSARSLETEGGYIALLEEELAVRKARDPKYSGRKFAADLGIENGALSRILAGQRPLSHKVAFRILDNLNWGSRKRADFLESVRRGAVELDRGAMSLERALRSGIVDGVSNIVRNPRGNNLEYVRSDLVVENSYNDDPSKGEIRVARAALDRVLKRNYKNKRLIITTAVQGAKADLNFLKSIRTFADRKNADIIILTLRPHLKALNDREYPLDLEIHRQFGDCIYKNVELNKHLSATTLNLRPSDSDPLAGIAELGAAEGRSIILAHTQQRLKTFPDGLKRIPRLQACTGACTLPMYAVSKAGLLGDKRHVIGAVVVEIHEGDTYHVRQVQADNDGSFIDLGVRYTPGGKMLRGESERPEALVRGDDHGGPEIFGDPVANLALDEATRYLRPKRVFVHDLFDAASVSHHREKSISAKINVPNAASSLKDELGAARRFLRGLRNSIPGDSELFVVGSNHNEHLTKYLDEGRWARQIDQNYKTALDLAHKYHIHGLEPLKQAIDPEGDIARWLGRFEEIKVEGITLSHHGDLGMNGSRGSVRSDLASFGRSIAGHSHSPEIYRSAMRVGTTSLLRMDYNAGPSSWAHCFGLVYKGGLCQLVIVVNGKWRLGDRAGHGRKKAPSPGTKKSRKRSRAKKVRN